MLKRLIINTEEVINIGKSLINALNFFQGESYKVF